MMGDIFSPVGIHKAHLWRHQGKYCPVPGGGGGGGGERFFSPVGIHKAHLWRHQGKYCPVPGGGGGGERDFSHL